MKVKLISRLLLFICLVFPITTYSLEYPNVNSKIIEIYDLTDEKLIYEVKASDSVSIASLTKIATAMVAIENINNLDEKVLITRNILNTVSREAHVVGLKNGDKVTYRDLLYATIVSSGADAANSLAILSSGSISNHVQKMNDLAKRIGLLHTVFKNVTGLDETGSYSTANDVKKLLIYALNNPLFEEIYTTKKYQLSNGLVITSTLNLYDKNGSIDTTSILGSKTGYTKKAGYCLSSISNINGHKMMIIVLNANKVGNDFYNVIDTVNLIKFMNNHYQDEILVGKNEFIKELPVEYSNIDSYHINAKEEVRKYLPSDYDRNSLKIVYDGLEKLSFQNHLGDKIGEISYYFNDELLLKEEVIINQEIKINILKILQKYYYIVIFFIIFIILIIVFLLMKKRKKRQSEQMKIVEII